MKFFIIVLITITFVMAACFLPRQGWAGVSVGVGIGIPAPVAVYPASAYYPPPPYYYPAPAYGPGVVVAPSYGYYGYWRPWYRHPYYYRRYHGWRRW